MKALLLIVVVSCSLIFLLIQISSGWSGWQKSEKELIISLAQQCLDLQSGHLKDPFSAKLVKAYLNEVKTKARVVKNATNDVTLTLPSRTFKEVLIDYRAKNSFGAYNKEVALCEVGLFDETKVRSTNDRLEGFEYLSNKTLSSWDQKSKTFRIYK